MRVAQTGRQQCDLVMKGGITSGVVYPGAVIELARDYSFRNVGGTSAGAIAAAVAAAAEYGRKRSGSEELPGFAKATADLTRPGFLQELLRPTAGAQPALDLFLRARLKGEKKSRRALGVLALLVRYAPLPGVAALLAGVALAVLAIATADSPNGVGEIVLAAVSAAAVAALLGCGAIALAARSVGRRLFDALNENNYGISRGQDLIEWLHAKVQACAGRTEHDPPLTFADLESEEIRLEVMTTDLSLARPVRLPLEESFYLFERADLEKVLPDPIVRHIVERTGAADRAEFLPGKDLPVVAAVRMSLSFPLLLSAVRLHSPHPKLPKMMENWFSDGGISSNFPIHFFDSWLPSHPTFGLDLRPFPGKDVEEHAPPVYMPAGPEEPLYPHWTGVHGLGPFLKQIGDAMRNWRDTMQAELPGSRDRVCQIRLGKREGGLNLDMEPAIVEALTKRGRDAGLEIRRKFDWRAHRFARYLTLMQMTEIGLQDVRRKVDELDADLRAGLPGVDVYRDGHDAAWLREAEAASRQLLDLVAEWGSPPAAIGFNRGYEPKPTPAMRVTPRA